MKKTIILAVTLLSGVALGAAGDLLVRTVETNDITGGQASTLMQCFRTANAWTGTNANALWCKVGRGGETGYQTTCAGLIPTDKNSVSYPVEIHGVE